jgi:diaminopimelate epimerase
MKAIPFTKMHGLGNCFVMVDAFCGDGLQSEDPQTVARAVCDRNTGVGADGLIVVSKSARCDLRMSIYNEDGSEAEMCGNGVRCLARFAVDEELTDKKELAIETRAGVIKTMIDVGDLVEVNMGAPRFESPDVPGRGGRPAHVVEEGRTFSFVSMGNPHAVAFVNDFDFDWRAEGARVERAKSFPNRTNVEYVRVVGPQEAEVKVWERGCGVTLACGTGACAVAVAGALEEKLDRAPTTIRLPGGPLRIHWTDGGDVLMTGPAVTICRGEYLYG